MKIRSMKPRAVVALLLILGAMALSLDSRAADVTIEPLGQDEFTVRIDGKEFTSYRHVGSAYSEKPIFYPVFSARGWEVNRQFPMVRGNADEQADHPHHQSAYFTYGDVNGVDYWNRDVRSKRHIEHKSAEADGATLRAVLEWIDPEEEVVLDEQKNVTFGGGDGVRWMDHDITLTARKKAVFGDSKEGAFGMRVSGRLKEKGGTGRYINAEGLETSAKVWGKTSPWVALRGSVRGEGGADEEVTIAIFSHPTTVHHPPYWHARDYGLFTANPFGRRGYDKSAEARETVLEPGESLRVRMKIVIYDGIADKDRLDKDYADYIKS